jgi:CRISPR-associated endonuclease Csn1
VKKATAEIIISMKTGKKVAVPSKKKGQAVLVPRGQLHNETVYGKIKKYAAEKTPLNGRFKLEFLDKFVSETERQLVKERLQQFENDPKKAFKNLDENPIIVQSGDKTKTLSAVTLWEEHFVVKYKLNDSFKEKDVAYIVDHGILELVRQRLALHGNDPKKAFKNLDQDPIWKNKSKGERVTSVRCFTGMSGLVPLHQTASGQTYAKSSLKENAKPVDYVSPSNNHHIAFYKMPDGKYTDVAVSLWEAVARKKAGIPVIVENPQAVWDKVLENGFDDQAILENLPPNDSTFLVSLSQNEFFVLGGSNEELVKLRNSNNVKENGSQIYRVQKISKKSSGSFDIYFRHHLETRVDDKQMGGEMLSKSIGRLIIIQSIGKFTQLNPVKIKLNVLGKMRLA